MYLGTSVFIKELFIIVNTGNNVNVQYLRVIIK